MVLHYDADWLCSDVIAHNARLCTREVAVACGDDQLTWGELEARTNKVANSLLGLGLVKGDKVCLFMPNSLPMFEMFWGAVKAGCVIVLLNTLLDGDALGRLANASDATVIFADDTTRAQIDAVRGALTHVPPDRFYCFGDAAAPEWQRGGDLVDPASEAPPGVKLEADDAMSIIYSSGTTGVPKGIEHTHFGRLNYPLGFGMGLRICRYSVAVCATPVFASGTWITMFPTMYRGGTVVLLPKFTAEMFLAAVARHRGTHAFLVPTQYIALLEHGVDRYDTSSLQVLITAGQPLSPTTSDAVLKGFPTAGLYEVYGMTEGFATLAIPEDAERGKRGTVGKAAFLEDIRIIDAEGHELPAGETGEIVAHGPGMMKGYYGRPDLTREATWTSPTGRTYLRSGDMGHVDQDGFLYVSGRSKDMIKSGGMNVFAVDIERVFMEHPGVSEVAVIGVPHDKWGETPLAVVITRSGAADSAEELREWVNERLARYQRVSQVVIRPELPRTTYGKVQKQRLREELCPEPSLVAR
jgi:acyl-CoA synthetase (AMP-forming)/AMP-acid ligase II